VVGQGLFGCRVGILSDGALSVRFANVHRAVFIDAAPGGRLVVAHCCSTSVLWSAGFNRSGSAYCRVTRVMTVGTCGAPDPSAPTVSGATPAEMICSISWSSPLVTVPTTVYPPEDMSNMVSPVTMKNWWPLL